MAEKYSIGLLGVMDRLWFHQIVLFSEPPSLSFPKTLEKPLPVQESVTCSPENNSQTSLSPQEELPFVASDQSIRLQDVCDKEEANREKSSPPKERPTRQNLIARRNRSHSSSPSTDYKKNSRNPKYMEDSGKSILDKTTSSKSLGELELEELKGFMDLGFKFNKEHISKRMISVLPGLQRLEVMPKGDEENNEDHAEASISDIAEDQEDKREIVRPYLSEAWLIKRPDSPLLNVKIPRRIPAPSDMKKHLKYWAKTVATVVQQES